MYLMTRAATEQLYATLMAVFGVDPSNDERDRGAISLEQVLWFVAVGVSVAVIAGILWTRIRDTANETDNINQPTAPNP